MIKLKKLDTQPYQSIWESMQAFVLNRTPDAQDEIWMLEHEPVFTQGKAGRQETILNPHDIPVVWSDRGGQVTYHGPGQIIAYFLLDLNRLGFGIKTLVNRLEESIIQLLAVFDVQATRKTGAPGVYVEGKKIASIGLRVRKGYTYHGLAFNFSMNLKPFSYIHPCGYEGLEVTQFATFFDKLSLTQSEMEDKLFGMLLEQFK